MEKPAPDRLDRLNMLPLSYRRDISDLCQLYKFIQDPRSLPPDSVLFRNDQRCTRQSESSIFSISRCKNLENFISTELYIVGTSFPSVKMQAHYLVLRKA